jgi:hypothetical protein
MPRFIQTLAVNDKATLCLAQRAYNDFCRAAAILARRPGRRLAKSFLVTNVPARRAEDNRAVPVVEDAENGTGNDDCYPGSEWSRNLFNDAPDSGDMFRY